MRHDASRGRPRGLEELQLRARGLLAARAMEFRPRPVAPVERRVVNPQIVIAIERDEHLAAHAIALVIERPAPGHNFTRRGFPQGVHRQLPYIDKGPSKSMLGSAGREGMDGRL